MGIVRLLRRVHNLRPKDPFYSHSNHQLEGILEVYTILLKYTLCKVVYCIFLYMNQNQLALLLLLNEVKCSLV